MRKLLIQPHSDDSALFAAFTCIREQPLVLTVFDGYVQAARGFPVTASQRREEDGRAIVETLGCTLSFEGLSDLAPKNDGIDWWAYIAVNLRERFARRRDDDFTRVWAPAYEEGGHPQHNLVALAAKAVWPDYTAYLTYTDKGKSTDGVLVNIEGNDWIPKKLRALSCYESQMIPELGCRAHFGFGAGRTLEEFYAR